MIPVTITVHKDGGAIVFMPHDCEALSYVQSTSFDGDTVQADEISAIIRRQNQTAADFLAQWRGVNGSTPVLLQSQGGRVEKYFFKPPLRRIGADKYQLDAQSPLARLSADFPGDIYNAKPLPDVIADIIGGAVPYTCNPLLGAVRVYGRAPYQSRRESIHALAFAYGFVIRRDAAQNLYFTVPDTDAATMPYNWLFTGGSVAYSVGETYYQAQITAKDYRKEPDAAPVTLFDNSGSVPAERLIVKFDKPAFDLSADDGLEILESGVNYAIVSGVGILTGKPYSEYVSVVTVDGDNAADPERVLTVDDAPLITSLNAASVAERLLAYRNADATVSADIVRTAQKPGDCVAFIDPFGDARQGYITALSGSITSIDRAAASIVCGYTPIWGAAYDALEVLSESGTWTAPAYLDGKTVRVVLIGGGTGGASGQHGSDAAATGSGRGLPGAGGNVLDVKIKLTAGQTFAVTIGVGGAGGTPTDASSADRPESMTVYVTRTGDRWHINPHCNGGTYTPTTLKAALARRLTPCENCVRDGASYYISNPGQPGTASAFGAYSTDDPKAKPADSGFYDIIHGDIYAAPGADNGIDGGQATAATENGDRDNPAYTEIQRFPVAPPWDDAQSWTSGSPGAGWHERSSTPEGATYEWAYGGLGGGAAVGSDGDDGAPGRFTTAVSGGDGGNGAAAQLLFPPDTRSYGSGGSGGHGGGEGGKGGSAHSDEWQAIDGADGSGGSGSAGQDGADGCVLIYFKKPSDFGQFRFRVPPGTGEVILDYYTETPPPFFADENHNLYYEYPDGETPPNFVRRGKQIYLITD